MRSLRDAREKIEALGAKLFGISVQGVESHKAFAEKEKLNFHLLADEERKVARNYGVLAPLGNYARRVTFFIDPKGIIRRIDEQVNVRTHGEDVVKILEELKKGNNETSKK